MTTETLHMKSLPTSRLDMKKTDAHGVFYAQTKIPASFTKPV